MKNRVLFAATISMLLCSVCLGFEDEGFQWWTYVEASTKLSEDWRAAVRQDLRMGDDGGNFYYEHSDLIFTYSGLAKWLDVAGGFRLVYEKDNENTWRRENRPLIDAILKGSFLNCSLTDRNRMEFRDFENKKDVWRYSNKFTVRFPFELTPLKLKPYAADEVFITLDDDNIDKNRIYLGTIWPLRKGIDFDIYYIHQVTKSEDEWKVNDVLGTGLKFEF